MGIHQTKNRQVSQYKDTAKVNAAVNILVAGGHTETFNGRGGKHKTTFKVVAACDMSTRRGVKARLFPRAFRPGRMSKMLGKLYETDLGQTKVRVNKEGHQQHLNNLIKLNEIIHL